MKSNLKKTIISSVPYVFIALFATKFGQTWRLADGITVSEKFLIWYIACSKKSYIFTNQIKSNRNQKNYGLSTGSLIIQQKNDCINYEFIVKYK